MTESGTAQQSLIAAKDSLRKCKYYGQEQKKSFLSEVVYNILKMLRFRLLDADFLQLIERSKLQPIEYLKQDVEAKQGKIR